MIERMLDETEAAELKTLQARAYGPNGGLASEDGPRLRELERKRRGVAAETVAEPVEASEASQISVAEPVEASDPPDEPGPPAEPDPSTGSGSGRAHRGWPALAAAVALLIGLGIGWMIWDWNSAEFALAMAHSGQRAELESTGNYDPGSVVAVSEQHGVVVWQAERSEGKEQCVIVTTESRTQSGCGAMDEPNTGSPGAAVNVPDGDELAGQRFSAFLVQSATGELVPTVQIWDDTNFEWEQQFTDEQLETIARIEAEGFVASSLSILGYDGDTAVWFSWDSQGLCLIAEADDGLVQGCMEAVEPNAELELTATVEGIPTNYVVRATERQGPQLTVVKLPQPDQVEVDIDSESGDPIEFTIDDPTFDDLAIDDKTGE